MDEAHRTPRRRIANPFSQAEYDALVVRAAVTVAVAAIDSTLLDPLASAADIEALCAEASGLGVRCVCVNSSRVAAAAKALAGTGIVVATVANFPAGNNHLSAVTAEIEAATRDGADEIDVVMPLGLMAERRWDEVGRWAGQMLASAGGRPVKAILETAAFAGQPDIVNTAAAIALEHGAACLKTSTGYHPAGGASPDAVARLRTLAGDTAKVKASGAIRTLDAFRVMFDHGADYIGTSAAAAIIAEITSAGQA